MAVSGEFAPSTPLLEAYQHLIECAPSPIWLTEAGRIKFANQQAVTLLRASSADEIVGRSPEEFFVQPDREVYRSVVGKTGPSERATNREVRLRALDGTAVCVGMTSASLGPAAVGVMQQMFTDRAAEVDAREALARTETELAVAADLLPALVAYVDPQGCYLRVNGRYAEWFGLPTSSILGQSVPGLLRTALGVDYWAKVEPAFREALSGVPSSAKTQGRFPDGIYRYVTAHYTPDLDRFGRVRGVVVLVADNSEQRAAEVNLEIQTSLLDQALEPIFTWRLDGGILSWNRAAESLYGYSKAEALGKISHELLHTECVIGIDALERELAERGRWTGELVHYTKLGSAVVVESRHSTVQRDGAVIVLECNRDVTEHKRILELRSQLAAIVTSSEDAIISLDLKGHITNWNDGARRLFGFEPDEVLGQPVSMLAWPGYEEDMPKLLARFTRGERIEQFETLRRNKDGRKIVVQLTISPIKNSEGLVTGAAKIIRDVTRQRQDAAEIRQLNETLEHRVAERTRQLENVNQALEAFSYSVSHDLRAPLRAVEGFSNILLRDYGERLDGAAQHYLARIRAATVRMGQLIESLLGLSRVSRAPLKRQKVDMAAMAQEIIAELKSHDPERTVEFIAADIPTAEGDARLIHIVLENLLNNAWKFSRKVPHAVLQLGSTTAHGEDAFFVKDNGAGFDMAYADQLFAPFQRLHAEKEFEGTGIGLATVARIVQRHGGTVWAESEPGRGATFYFTLQ